MKILSLIGLGILLGLNVSAAPNPLDQDRDSLKLKLLNLKAKRDVRVRQLRSAHKERFAADKVKHEKAKLAGLKVSRDREATKLEHLKKDQAFQKKWEDLKEQNRLEVEKVKQGYKDQERSLKAEFNHKHPRDPNTNRRQ